MSDISQNFAEYFLTRGSIVWPASQLTHRLAPHIFIPGSHFASWIETVNSPSAFANDSLLVIQPAVRLYEDVTVTRTHLTLFTMGGVFCRGNPATSLGALVDFLLGYASPRNLWATVSATGFVRGLRLSDDEASAQVLISRGVPASQVLAIDAEAHEWKLRVQQEFDGGEWRHSLAHCSTQAMVSARKVDLYFDLGASRCAHEGECRPGERCPRFVEVGSMVFSPRLVLLSGARNGNDEAWNREAASVVEIAVGIERLELVRDDARSLLELPAFEGYVRNAAGSALAAAQHQWTSSGGIPLRWTRVLDHVRTYAVCSALSAGKSSRSQREFLRALLRRLKLCAAGNDTQPAICLESCFRALASNPEAMRIKEAAHVQTCMASFVDSENLR